MNKDVEVNLSRLPTSPVMNVIPFEKVKTIHRCQNSIDKYLYNAEDEQEG